MTPIDPNLDRPAHDLARGELERKLHLVTTAGQQALLLARGWKIRAERAEAALAEQTQLDQELAKLTDELNAQDKD